MPENTDRQELEARVQQLEALITRLNVKVIEHETAKVQERNLTFMQRDPVTGMIKPGIPVEPWVDAHGQVTNIPLWTTRNPDNEDGSSEGPRMAEQARYFARRCGLRPLAEVPEHERKRLEKAHLADLERQQGERHKQRIATAKAAEMQANAAEMQANASEKLATVLDRLSERLGGGKGRQAAAE